MDYCEIGGRIRNLRIERGISQETLAERADITPVYISQIERAARHASLPVLMRLATALDTNIEYLLTGVAEVSKKEFDRLLSDCSAHEQLVIVKVAAALKKALREEGTAA